MTGPADVHADPGARPPGTATGRPEGTDAERPVSTLRGAGVDVDHRRLGRIAAALVLVALAATSVGLFIAGAHHNQQIDELRHGVPVDATVTSCLGLLGGSGSNAAGYACRGSYTVDGIRYGEAIPGSTLLRTGSHVRLVAASGDPSLVTTPALLRRDRTSWHVFVVPAILLFLLLVVGAVAGWRGRRSRSPT